MRRLLPFALSGMVLLSACGSTPQAAAPTAAPATAPTAEATAAPAAEATAAPAAEATTAPAAADLTTVKAYLLDNVAVLKGSTADLVTASNAYYDMAKAANFDYAALWKADPKATQAAVDRAREAWKLASPGYEKIEGLVAGVPTLADYDVILDAGASAEEGGDSVVPFDLSLPDGRTLAKPGNLFGVTEKSLWGTEKAYTAPAEADFNGDGAITFGEALPDANVLKAGAEALDRYTGELSVAAQNWQPNESDAFTALVVMVPTMNEYFESWKNSRFVAGDASTQGDFVAISRLADMQDILSGLEVVYSGISPLVNTVDAAQSKQIGSDLTALRSFIADIYTKEQGGQKFTAEDADLLGAEAQNRATAITGQISQVAAKLNVSIQE